MRHATLVTTLLAAGALVLPDLSRGHGGTYRGPGDTVPPGSNPGGPAAPPSSPGPGGAGRPGPSSGPNGPGTPTTPGGAPQNPGGRPTSPGGAELGPDLTQWDFWWGFNKEPYLALKAKIRASSAATGSDDFFLGKGQANEARDTYRPSEHDIRDVVVPALVRALEEERANDIVTGAMLALAKIGDVAREDGQSDFVALFERFLPSGSQEISETAALALGILADERALPRLVALMLDTPDGRRAIGRSEVPPRTRAFAAFGLGLVGYRTASNTTRQRIAEHLVEVLECPEFSTRDLKVAAMSALGLVPLEWTSSRDTALGDVPAADAHPYRAVAADRTALLAYLTAYLDPANERKNQARRHWFVRSHAPLAIARLAQAGPAPADSAASDAIQRAAELFLEVTDTHTTERREVVQSAVIALGMLADATDEAQDSPRAGSSARMRARLAELAASSADNQTEYFALIALAESGARRGVGVRGEVGVAEVQKVLLRELGRAKGQKQPWTSLALGVFGHARRESGAAPDTALRSALRMAFAEDRAPATVGAHALALGLIGDTESVDSLLARFQDDFAGSDETRGYLAVALGLLGAREAIGPIQAVVAASKYRPDLLKEAAVALGLLGDKQVVPALVDMLKTARGLSSQAAIASALGTIGDRNAIAPLVEFLGDGRYTDTARAFAAVALGIVCDKEDLPWNAKLAVRCNYRANTPTLTSGGQGVLDIL